MPIRNSVLESIARRPWTSAQDALLGVSVIAIAALFAIEYELFHFGGQMADSERRITVFEAFLLTALLALCITGFVYRRMQEQKRDALRRLEVEQEIAKWRDEAMRDALTGLFNRRVVMGRLAQLATLGSAHKHALLLLDLNDFKQVNDEFGHGTGDTVLQIVAERFRRVARPSDLLARIGGDEFAVLAYDIDRNGALAVGMRFLASLKTDVSVEGTRHKLGVSVGVVLIPDHGSQPEELLAKADLAMYWAKNEERSALAFYAPSMGGRRPGRTANA